MPDSLWPHGLQPTRLLCPWDFSRQGYWSGLPFPSPGDLPNPGIEPRSPALQADSLPTELQGKPISSVQSLSHVRLFATPWIATRQASLSNANCQSLPKPMSIESVMPSNHLILCHPLLLPSIFHQGLFKAVSSLHQVVKVLEFQLQHQSFQWTPRTDLL